MNIKLVKYMAYESYPKDQNRYDIDASTLSEGIMSIPIEGDASKDVTSEQIDAAIATCQTKENYETETRYSFWAAARAKFDALNV